MTSPPLHDPAGEPAPWAGVPQVVPVGDRSSRRRITPEREAKFLEALALTGDMQAASRAVSQHTGGPAAADHAPGFETWRRHRKNTPAFDQRCREAESVAYGALVQMLFERVAKPDRRPILDRAGKVVAYAEDHRNCNQLLMRALEKISPDWVQKKNVGLQGEVKHTHTVEIDREARFFLDAGDVALLPEEDQYALHRLLEKIEDARETAKAQKSLPPPPEIVGDAESRPVE
jgi:hypothetical protein